MREAHFVIPGRLPGLNELIDAKSYKAKMRIKAAGKRQVQSAVFTARPVVKPFTEPVCVSIRCFEPNAKRDPDNVTGGANKIILDALQEIKVIANDNQKHIPRLKSELAGVDREKPRIEVDIWEVEA